jgi:hypothetical protein
MSVGVPPSPIRFQSLRHVEYVFEVARLRSKKLIQPLCNLVYKGDVNPRIRRWIRHVLRFLPRGRGNIRRYWAAQRNGGPRAEKAGDAFSSEPAAWMSLSDYLSAHALCFTTYPASKSPLVFLPVTVAV